MSEQLTLLVDVVKSESLKKKKQAVKRKWENAFQRWSNEQFIGDGINDYGCCGYGAMCDWCEDNSYGRPCVRALNSMCREKGIYLNYASQDFVKVWRGEL